MKLKNPPIYMQFHSQNKAYVYIGSFAYDTYVIFDYRADCEYIQEVVKPYDWTYSTNYKGNVVSPTKVYSFLFNVWLTIWMLSLR